MITKIHINKFIVKASIGITAAERASLQPLHIDICLTIDARKAMITDNVLHTVSYSAVQKAVQTIVQSSSYNLLETLADKIAEACLSFELVTDAEISILKPHILAGSVSAGITHIANKHEYNLP